jgi:hypothetical protein
MRIPLIATIAAGLALFAGPALAQDANSQDVKCIIIGFLVAGQKDGQMPGAMMVSYFQGRIDSRAPNINLVELIKKEGAAFDMLPEADRKALGDRCFTIMNNTRKVLEGLNAAPAVPAAK